MSSGVLRVTLSSETSKGTPREKAIREYGIETPIETFPLTGMTSGAYQIHVELLDPSGRPVAERGAAITLSPRTEISRSGFVFRHSFNTESPGLLAMARGQQHMARTEFAEAEARMSIDCA